MNYRHIYHAGNFADVMKHLALVLCIDYLKQKEKGFFVLDAHGGCGLYDLKSEQAQKTKEYEAGIAALMAVQEAPDDIQLYQRQIAKDWKRKHYPGSPLLIARMLRPQDQLLANELHPEDVQTLKANLGGFENARVLQMDAYEAIRAHIPPTQRRGLVLIDPPFEKKDEFQTLVKQMKEWKKRWPTGTYMIWYPIKAHLPVPELHEAAQNWGEDVFIWEFLKHPRHQAETFNGSGVILLNPPYQVPGRLSILENILRHALRGIFETYKT
ncbi:MAG: 23S rRNA (adenine(2030)-N(6))-methyltransferase RlmJ [Alphaproteobacteria bacterium]|nr:23S rRNA (adenine(2030)-N(6))-methyltransferase RlmJ [Alphaproteobacteria bacterium]